MNIKLTIEYDGTNYHGWQVQPNGPTVQEILEQALKTLLGVRCRVNGSGRTDAGVHALGQVANFFCPETVDLSRLHKGLNALTPDDIVVKQVESVPDSFDARRDAKSRIYVYRIWNRRVPSAFYRRYSWHVYRTLEIAPMQEAIRCLEGEHNFASFQAAGCEARHAVRRVYSNAIAREGDFLVYSIEATAFLRHMVRNIVGTLVQVGRGERSPADFARLLASQDRTLAGPTAPAQGLFLAEVKY